jgi:hypothetical protein
MKEDFSEDTATFSRFEIRRDKLPSISHPPFLPEMAGRHFGKRVRTHELCDIPVASVLRDRGAICSPTSTGAIRIARRFSIHVMLTQTPSGRLGYKLGRNNFGYRYLLPKTARVIPAPSG